MKQREDCLGKGIAEYINIPGVRLCECIEMRLAAADKMAAAISRLMAYRSFGVVVQPAEKAVFDAFAEYQST